MKINPKSRSPLQRGLLVAAAAFVGIFFLDLPFPLIVVAAALLTLALLARSQALAVQDRVIRMEMRLRLRQALPADLHPRIHDLSARQLVALRFASDAELPELVREILDGKLETGKQIKQRVKNWQSDWLRA
jgi:hypothetical protein